MAKLGGNKTEKFILPSTKDLTGDEQGWVIINHALTMGIVIDGQQYESSPLLLTAFILSKAIEDWNMLDEQGNKEPITVDNVKRLPTEDFHFLNDKLDFRGSVDKESEKKISDVPPINSAEQTAVGEPTA